MNGQNLFSAVENDSNRLRNKHLKQISLFHSEAWLQNNCFLFIFAQVSFRCVFFTLIVFWSVFVQFHFVKGQNNGWFGKVGAKVNYGIQQQTGGVDANLDGANQTETLLKYRLGSGLEYSFQCFKHRDSSKFQPAFELTYYDGGKTLYSRSRTSSSFSYTSLELKYVSASVGFLLDYQIGKAAFKTGLLVNVPFYSVNHEVTSIQTAQYSSLERWRINYKIALGATIAQEFRLALSHNISLHSGVQLGFLQLNRKSKKIQKYSHSQGRTMAEAYPVLGSRELKYLSERQIQEKGNINNPESNSANYNPNQPTETFSIQEYASSLGFGIGIVCKLF